MLRKMLIALMAVVALGVGSTAMARGGGGSHGGSFAPPVVTAELWR